MSRGESDSSHTQAFCDSKSFLSEGIDAVFLTNAQKVSHEDLWTKCDKFVYLQANDIQGAGSSPKSVSRGSHDKPRSLHQRIRPLLSERFVECAVLRRQHAGLDRRM